LRVSKDEATELESEGDPQHPLAQSGRRHITSMPSLRPRDGLPDLGAAVRAFIDEIDLRHAPMGVYLSDKHGNQSYATGTHDRHAIDLGLLEFVMLDEGWHVGLLHYGSKLNPEPI
jgi:hypothetical protein